MKNILTLIAIVLFSSSCFKQYIHYDEIQKWDYEKMKKIGAGENDFVVYFTNNRKTICKLQLRHNQFSARVSPTHAIRAVPGIYEGQHKASNFSTPIKSNNNILPEVQIFVSEEFRGQDTLVINSSNFIQMRVYSLDQGATVMRYIGLTAVVIILITLVFGYLAYYTYLKSAITLSL